MKLRIETDDNDFILPIPQSFADSLGLDSGSEVELAVVGGQLVITPIADRKHEDRLEDLLQQIDDDNMHDEYPL